MCNETQVLYSFRLDGLTWKLRKKKSVEKKWAFILEENGLKLQKKKQKDCCMATTQQNDIYILYILFCL